MRRSVCIDRIAEFYRSAIRLSANHRQNRKENIIMNENLKKLTDLKAEVEVLVVTYNEAIQEKNMEAATKADKDMAEKINEYTSITRKMCFDECKAAPNPMLKAIEMLSFTTIRVKDSPVTDENPFPVRAIEDRLVQIDLIKLHDHCGGIGANKNWLNMARKLNLLLTVQKAVDLGIDPKSVNDSYAISDIARQIDLGKTPTSKTNLLKTLQSIIAAMLGDGYKATSHDVNFLMSVYSRKSRKALTVTVANDKRLVGYLAEICHKIVTNKGYVVDGYKTNEK